MDRIGYTIYLLAFFKKKYSKESYLVFKIQDKQKTLDFWQ